MNEPIQHLARLRLAHLPTPLERMPRLGALLGLDQLFVKRDDCTGLGLGATWNDDRVEIAAEWSAGAYGIADATTREAIRLAARLEALALDPVYSGKGMAGLIGLARQGIFQRNETVVWLHTGGSPGMFAYPETMARLSG